MGRWPVERPLWMFSSDRTEASEPAEPSWLEPAEGGAVEELGPRGWGEVHAWATGIAAQLRSAAVMA